jgi:hypothetical protein|tara:strand:+ start:347 stop:784 length:438 start_codon:yes stop_codon:yes gene_type:complete
MSEFKLTDMQASFVWHYTEGACGQTEAARRAGYEFPAASANKLLKTERVVKAVKIKQDELAEKYAITPQKTGAMLWKIAETSYENGYMGPAVSAIKELNQLAGLSINRSQNININANVDKMSKEQIKERLEKLLGVSTEYEDDDY